MAVPSLKHQIEFVDTIVVMRATTVNEGLKYIIEEVLKSLHAQLKPGDDVRADFSIFTLLGYDIKPEQTVVALLAIRKNLLDYDCIDFLPVDNGSIVYGKDDVSVREELTLDALKRSIELATRE